MKLLVSLFVMLLGITMLSFAQDDSTKSVEVKTGILQMRSILYKDISFKSNIVTKRKIDDVNFNPPPEIDPLKTQIDYTMLAGFGLLVGGSIAVVHQNFVNSWWKKDSLYTGKFHVMNDWYYALWVDKIGHMYATHLLAHAFSGGFDASNFTAEQSTWYSASLALLYELYIETEDGYAYPKWGFSPGDATGDFLGSAFYVSQYYYPFLKNFQLRWSYYPSEAMRNGTHKGNISDDYEGQIYWVSMRMKNMLPEKISTYWPAFLNLSLGYGVNNLDGSGGGKREFYLSFDLDAEELPLHGSIWQFVKNTLNYIHFPMPGIRITPDAKSFVFCF